MSKKKVIEKFKVTNEQGVQSEISLELLIDASDSGYGNGNYILLVDSYQNENLFDARYDRRFDNEKSFRKYAFEFVRDYVRPTCKLEKA